MPHQQTCKKLMWNMECVSIKCLLLFFLLKDQKTLLILGIQLIRFNSVLLVNEFLV